MSAYINYPCPECGELFPFDIIASDITDLDVITVEAVERDNALQVHYEDKHGGSYEYH